MKKVPPYKTPFKNFYTKLFRKVFPTSSGKKFISFMFSIKKEFLLALLLLALSLLSAFAPAIFAGRVLFLEVIEDPNNLFSFYPWNVFSASLYHAGHFPLYNPFNACGVPLLANLQSAPLYPLHLLLFLRPTLSAFDVFLILRLFLVGVGIYLFSCKIELSHQSAIGAMLCAVFGGFFVRYRSMVHLNVEVLLPWAFWAVSRVSAIRSWKNFVILTAILSVSLLGGNAESSFFVFLCALLWAVWLRLFDKTANLILTMFAMITSILISSAQILPFLEYLPHTWHIHKPGAGAQWLDPRLSVGFLTPFLFPAKPGIPPYVGGVAISLALVGASKNKKSLFFLLLSFFLLGLVYPIPGFKWLTYLPMFNQIASYKYGLAPLTIAIAILAGFGIEALIKKNISPRKYLRSAFAVAVFASFFVLGALIIGEQVNYLALVFMVSLLVVACLFVFFAPLRHGICALLGIELIAYFFATPTRTLINPSQIANSPSLQYLTERKNEGRLASSLGAGFLPNLNLLLGVHEVGLFDALYPKNYLTAVSNALGFEWKKAEKFFKEHAYQFPVTTGSTFSPIWDELGVKFFLGKDLAISTEKELVTGLWENKNAKPLVEMNGTTLPPISSDFWSYNLPSDLPTGTIIFRYNYLPGWRCWIGEREVKIKKNSLGFMEVETNSHKQLALRYMPYSFRIGLWMMLTTIFTISLTFIAIPIKNFLRKTF